MELIVRYTSELTNEINWNSEINIASVTFEFLSDNCIFELLEERKDILDKRVSRLQVCSCAFDNKILQFAQEMKVLRSLSLEACWKLLPLDLEDFLSKGPIENLISLNLSSTKINDRCLQILSARQNNIVDLNISFCSLVKDEGLIALIQSQNFLQLTTLYLKCLFLTDKTLSQLASSKLKLNKLSLYKCYNCSPVGMQLVINSPLMNALQYFDVSSSLFSDSNLQRIAERQIIDCSLMLSNQTKCQQQLSLDRSSEIKALEKLKFYECSNITNLGVRSLFESDIVTQLTVLDLSWTYFENETLEILLQKKLRLTELCISMIPSIQTETLNRFFTQTLILKTLEDLDLSYSQIDDELIQKIIEISKTVNGPLKNLLAYSCSKITNKKYLQSLAKESNIVLYV